MARAADHPASARAYRSGGTALFLGSAVILTALGFEHIGGFTPCPLCLMQRWAYYAAIPVLFVAMALASEKPRIAALLFFLVALGFLANAVLGGYHAGVEWKLWPGPDTCATAQNMPGTASEILSGMNERVIRCDEAAWRLLGLSFAGWNVVASLALMGISMQAAFAASERVR
jgi:disulfide bond formation protein DsbB